MICIVIDNQQESDTDDLHIDCTPGEEKKMENCSNCSCSENGEWRCSGECSAPTAKGISMINRAKVTQSQ